MSALLHGVPWIHIIPALLAVIFSFLYLKTKLIYIKIIFGILWLILIPNTAYIFTDVERITLHWESINVLMRCILVIQFMILEITGLLMYFFAMLPLEQIMRRTHLSQNKQIMAISLLNILIGFGMVLGRTGYVNSYVVFTRPSRVYTAAMNIITSFNLFSLSMFYGIACLCIYLLFRNMLLQHMRKLL